MPARPAGPRQAEHGSGQPIGNYEMNAGPDLLSEAIVTRDSDTWHTEILSFFIQDSGHFLINIYDPQNFNEIN